MVSGFYARFCYETAVSWSLRNNHYYTQTNLNSGWISFKYCHISNLDRLLNSLESAAHINLTLKKGSFSLCMGQISKMQLISINNTKLQGP